MSSTDDSRTLTEIEANNILENCTYTQEQIVEYVKKNYNQYTGYETESEFNDDNDLSELSATEFCFRMGVWNIYRSRDNLQQETTLKGDENDGLVIGKAMVIKEMMDSNVQFIHLPPNTISSVAPEIQESTSSVIDLPGENESEDESAESASEGEVYLFGGGQVESKEKEVGELEEKTAESDEENQPVVYDSCNVCYTDLTGENIVNTPCGHNFCTTCFFKWMKEKTNCPCCRKEYCETPFSNDEEIREEMGMLYKIRTDLLERNGDLVYENYRAEMRTDDLYYRSKEIKSQLVILNKSIISNRETIDWQRGYIDGVYAKNIEESVVNKKEIKKYIKLFLRETSSNDIGNNPYTCGFIQGFQETFRHYFKIPDELNELIDYEIEHENEKMYSIINTTVKLTIESLNNDKNTGKAKVESKKSDTKKSESKKSESKKSDSKKSKPKKKIKKSVKLKVTANQSSESEVSSDEEEDSYYETELSKKKKRVNRYMKARNDISQWCGKKPSNRFIYEMSKMNNKKEKTEYRAMYVKTKKSEDFDPKKYKIVDKKKKCKKHHRIPNRFASILSDSDSMSELISGSDTE